MPPARATRGGWIAVRSVSPPRAVLSADYRVEQVAAIRRSADDNEARPSGNETLQVGQVGCFVGIDIVQWLRCAGELGDRNSQYSSPGSMYTRFGGHPA